MILVGYVLARRNEGMNDESHELIFERPAENPEIVVYSIFDVGFGCW